MVDDQFDIEEQYHDKLVDEVRSLPLYDTLLAGVRTEPLSDAQRVKIEVFTRQLHNEEITLSNPWRNYQREDIAAIVAALQVMVNPEATLSDADQTRLNNLVFDIHNSMTRIIRTGTVAPWAAPF